MADVGDIELMENSAATRRSITYGGTVVDKFRNTVGRTAGNLGLRSLSPFYFETIAWMLPRLAYRQFHDQTNIAVAVSVVMAEFGLIELDASKPRQELTLHGLLQRGLYAEDRGMLLRNALRHLAVAGLKWTLLHEPARTAAIESLVKREVPDYEFRFLKDLKSPAESGFHLESALSGGARLMLVEARPYLRGIAVHVLVARREGDRCYVMNSHTGHDHDYELGHVARHIASPVSMGAVSFAGLQYMYTGIAVRIWRQ